MELWLGRGNPCKFNLLAEGVHPDMFSFTFGWRPDGFFIQWNLSDNIIVPVKGDKTGDYQREAIDAAVVATVKWGEFEDGLIRAVVTRRQETEKKNFNHSMWATICLMMFVYSKPGVTFSEHLNRMWGFNPNILVHEPS